MIIIEQLGKLEKVEIRSVWQKEDRNFTPWLAKEENLKMLSDEIGIDIELKSTEAKTGSFSADILAFDPNTDDKIIIENQFEQTDHDHLGKLITYASGFDAKTIIWITEKVREEHRKAIDWLNEHTDEDINIFLCKIELWKIADSPTAPKFQIISSPNDWGKSMKRSSDNKTSSNNLLQLEYWTKVRDEIDKNYPKFNSRKPTSRNFYDMDMGARSAHIALNINKRSSEIRTRIWINSHKEVFEYLYGLKDEIESELGYTLNWINKDNFKSSSIEIVKNIDINNENNWDEAIEWQLTKASEFYDAFSERIKNFEQ